MTTDRGEKIINLAYEMLQADGSVEAPAAAPKYGVSLRVLCLTTILAALTGGGVTEFIEQIQRPINRYERTELDALVFYAAREKNLDAADLRREVQDKLAVSSLNDLTRHEFEIARRYLQDRAQ